MFIIKSLSCLSVIQCISGLESHRLISGCLDNNYSVEMQVSSLIVVPYNVGLANVSKTLARKGQWYRKETLDWHRHVTIGQISGVNPLSKRVLAKNLLVKHREKLFVWVISNALRCVSSTRNSFWYQAQLFGSGPRQQGCCCLDHNPDKDLLPFELTTRVLFF